MKYFSLSLFFLVSSLLSFTSCTDDPLEPEKEMIDPEISLINLSDSCSFTIDGEKFTFGKIYGEGKEVAGVNLDSQTDKGHPDSLLYSTSFDLDGENSTFLTVRFIKKYGKNQLTQRVSLLFNGPADEGELYRIGHHTYAVDYGRFNTQNGVALKIYNSPFGNLQSYLPDHRRQPTTLGLDYQNNSKFEILRFQRLPNGYFLIEAKFTANVLSYKATSSGDIVDWNTITGQKRVENGYLRMQIRVN